MAQINYSADCDQTHMGIISVNYLNTVILVS